MRMLVNWRDAGPAHQSRPAQGSKLFQIQKAQHITSREL